MPDTMGMEPSRFLRPPTTITAGNQQTFDCNAMKNLTVIAGAGATVTVSRVDALNAVAHTTGAENQFTVAPTTRTVTPVDWPFFLISTAGGSCRVAVT